MNYCGSLEACVRCARYTTKNLTHSEYRKSPYIRNALIRNRRLTFSTKCTKLSETGQPEFYQFFYISSNFRIKTCVKNKCRKQFYRNKHAIEKLKYNRIQYLFSVMEFSLFPVGPAIFIIL